MQSPVQQLTIPQSTQPPNEIMDFAMRELSAAAVKCYLAILRMTYGAHKQAEFIPHNQFTEITGYSKRRIHEAFVELEVAELISRNKQPGMVAQYTILRLEAQA